MDENIMQEDPLPNDEDISPKECSKESMINKCIIDNINPEQVIADNKNDLKAECFDDDAELCMDKNKNDVPNINENYTESNIEYDVVNEQDIVLEDKIQSRPSPGNEEEEVPISPKVTDSQDGSPVSLDMEAKHNDVHPSADIHETNCEVLSSPDIQETPSDTKPDKEEAQNDISSLLSLGTADVPSTSPQNYEHIPTEEVKSFAASPEQILIKQHKAEKIDELQKKVERLESTLKEKDHEICTLKEEVSRLNIEIKSRSAPTGGKKVPAVSDPKSRSVGAPRKPVSTRPTSGAKAVPKTNGVACRKPASPRKPAPPTSRPKTAPSAKSASGKKSSKGGQKMEVHRGVDGEEHAVKLFLRGRGIVCYPPTDYTAEDIKSEKPEQTLKINWVYGYRGRDSQDNIFCLPSNELLYYQAALAVIYNPATKTQRFYQGHNDDIKCIALNPKDNNIVASGQTAGHDDKEGDPHVRVWNAKTLETIAVMGMGQLQRGVGSVSFSADGSKLLAVDEGNDHNIFIFDWNKKSKIAYQKGHQDPVLGAEFLPGSNSKFVSYGKGHILFWELDSSNKLIKKSGLFEKNPKPRFITSVAFTSNGDTVSGDSSGNVFIWSSNDRRIIKSKPGAHEGTVYSIVVRGEDIYTGGQDCKVKIFGADLSEVDTWQLDNATHGKIKAIAFVGDELAVGTYNNGMLVGRFGEEPTQVIYGHGAGDLWGGADHPTDNTFATVGQDKVVYVWDAETHQPKHIFKVEKPAQACSFSPCGSVLAVSSTTGEWYVLDSNSGEVLSEYKSGPEQIDAISYSPDGKKIAVGSHDNFVYLFSCEDVRSDYKLIGKCSGHSSFITHLDFSEDGTVLQTTSGDYEHLFWNTENSDQITNTKDLRDVKMATYTCTLGFSVCGIWPVGYDGTDINALCRSNDQNLVVTADDFGLVNLFRYPCCNPTAEWSSYRGHSAHVTKVRFLRGDKELFSLGGRDQSIIQWGVN